LGERHDLTYLSADERSYERDARKLETVEAALFGRARCRRAVRVGEPKGGRRRRCNLGPCNGRGGERERDVHAVAGCPRSALALGEITSTSTAPDQRRDLEEHTGVIER
jgi:hypothetical protein